MANEVIDYNKYLSEQALTTVEALIDAIRTSPQIPDSLFAVDEDGNFDDGILWHLSTIINDISSQVNVFIGRDLALNDYSEVKTNAATEELNLDNFPIKEVKTVSVYNGESFTPVDDRTINLLTDLSDFKRGVIFMTPVFRARTRNVGLNGYRQKYLKSVKVEYSAGYVLPKDETEDVHSDLPRDIEGIVLRNSREIFIRTLNANKADGLTRLQEGNISREWASNISIEAAKFGELPLVDQRILSRYRVTKALYSV